MSKINNTPSFGARYNILPEAAETIPQATFRTIERFNSENTSHPVIDITQVEKTGDSLILQTRMPDDTKDNKKLSLSATVKDFKNLADGLIDNYSKRINIRLGT